MSVKIIHVNKRRFYRFCYIDCISRPTPVARWYLWLCIECHTLGVCSFDLVSYNPWVELVFCYTMNELWTNNYVELFYFTLSCCAIYTLLILIGNFDSQLGGFKLPFLVVGCVMIIVAFLTIWMVPSQTCRWRLSQFEHSFPYCMRSSMNVIIRGMFVVITQLFGNVLF